MSILAYEKRGPIAVLTLNRPDAMNALGQDGDGLAVANVCAEILSDNEIHCAILTGAGRAFSAGGDLKAMQSRTGQFGGDAMALRDGYRRNIHQIIKSLYHFELPIVSAINGPAIGLGCDVACLGDLRIASDKARFGSTFLSIGLIPGDGGAWLLPRIVGDARAAELLYTGKIIDAETAAKWGLVSEVVTPDALMDTAMTLAEQVAAQPPHALRMAKSLLRHGATASFETIMDMSAASQAITHLTEDHMEGVNAMLEKRPAVFKGK